MRVLICAPWFRTLARRHARALEQRGHEVLLLTTAAQGDRITPPFDNEVTLNAKLKDRHLVPMFLRAQAEVRAWGPDVALLDETWDPRFFALAKQARKTVTLVHDANAHDDGHSLHGWKRIVAKKTREEADELACFSQHVHRELRARQLKVSVLPLLSELEALALPLNLPARKVFSFVGRISEYKGIPFLLRAWEKFVESNPGQELQILGLGNTQEWPPLPAGVIHHNKRFNDQEAVDLLLRSRATILPYLEASQSGVQVLSMQCGAPTIVTDVGALPQMQPPHLDPVGYGDVDALVQRMQLMLSDTRTQQYSQMALEHYRQHHSDSAASRALDTLVISATTLDKEAVS